jgi:hypothetical protein
MNDGADCLMASADVDLVELSFPVCEAFDVFNDVANDMKVDASPLVELVASTSEANINLQSVFGGRCKNVSKLTTAVQETKADSLTEDRFPLDLQTSIKCIF